MSSLQAGQVTLTPVCEYAVATANSSDLAFYDINNRVHSLVYWLSIFNCSIISYFIAASLEKPRGPKQRNSAYEILKS